MAVLPIIKTTRGEAPSYQIKVVFPRDEVSNSAIRFNDPRSHTVLFKFKPGAYTVDDHLVTDETEFEGFVKDSPEQIRGKAKDPPAAPALKNTEPGLALFGGWGSSATQPSKWNPTEWDSTKDTSDLNTAEWDSSFAANVTDEVFKKKWRGTRLDKEW